jgi:nitrite reductase (NADH) large subunit
VVDDAEGICARLDAAQQRSSDAHPDPCGQDGRAPATPGQFAPCLPLVPLLQAPVR